MRARVDVRPGVATVGFASAGELEGEASLDNAARSLFEPDCLAGGSGDSPSECAIGLPCRPLEFFMLATPSSGPAAGGDGSDAVSSVAGLGAGEEAFELVAIGGVETGAEGCGAIDGKA
jgi:hypothetical protein